MKGKKKTHIITAEWVLERVSEWQVYKLYLPNMVLGRKILSPFRREKNPSLSIFSKNGRIYHFDFGASEFRGDCFSFVQQLFGLNYPQALNKIAEDAGLVTGKDGQRKRKIVYESPEIIEQPIIIKVRVWPKWRREHKDYLRDYYLSPEDLNFCNDTTAFPLREWAMNGSRMPLEADEVGFAYNLKDEEGDWLKIYRPNRGKEEKWRSSIPFTKLHNKGAISGGCDVGILTKSLKEGAWINKYILPCVEIIQAEDITALSVEDGRRIKQNCKKLFVAMDADEKGKKTSWALTKALDCFHINPIDSLLDLGGTDFTDWAKLTDNQTVIQHFKNKKLI